MSFKQQPTQLKLDDRGLYWLKIDIANTYGLDKELFPDRTLWVDTNNLILETLCTEADSPVEYLNAVGALRDYESNKEVKHYMYLDCSNQALQIYGIVTGDIQTASICNLAGFDGKLADAYSMLAVQMNKQFKTQLFTRKNCKRSLMTTLYGKQNGGDSIIEDMTAKEVRQLAEEGITAEALNHAFEEAMKNIAPNAMDAMAKIQNLNSEYIGTYNWTLPDGFRVKYDVKSKQQYEGKRTSKSGIEFSFETEVEVYRPSRLNAGMAPNVIHSIDGFIVREMVRRMGNKFMTTIHDAYAVHPNDVDMMIANYQDIMVELLASNILDDIMKQIADNRVYIKVTKEGTLTEKHIRESIYALA